MEERCDRMDSLLDKADRGMREQGKLAVQCVWRECCDKATLKDVIQILLRLSCRKARAVDPVVMIKINPLSIGETIQTLGCHHL